MKFYQKFLLVIIGASLGALLSHSAYIRELGDVQTAYKDTLSSVMKNHRLERKLCELKTDRLRDSIQNIRLNNILLPRIKD